MPVGFDAEPPKRPHEDLVDQILDDSFPHQEGPIFLTDDIADEASQFLDETDTAFRFEIAGFEERHEIHLKTMKKLQELAEDIVAGECGKKED